MEEIKKGLLMLWYSFMFAAALPIAFILDAIAVHIIKDEIGEY